MAGTKAPTKEPTQVETSPDLPVPAQPAPRPKDAPRTMRQVRESRNSPAPVRISESEPITES